MTNPTGRPEKPQQRLFDGQGEGDEDTRKYAPVHRKPQDHSDDSRVRHDRTRNSMLWAAYGDALGFISELVGEKMLNRRTKGAALDHLMAWERRVGGRTGVMVRLPSGCWSDDTQLRMAVSRSIDHHGFDVDTFARIEIPVWPSYALGGGRASKAAARNLGKPRTTWYANTFKGWPDAGGNGAAMRIQPHVWSSRDWERDFLEDVIVDSICTHGHLRAIVGACFHAVSLAHSLKEGRVPSLDRCDEIASELEEAVGLIEDHRSLGPTWIGIWEQATGKTLGTEWKITVSELRDALAQVANEQAETSDVAGRYRRIADRLGLEEEHQRGSGILTTVAAAALARIATTADQGIVTAANALGTDTDTIATMAGALLGACDDSGTLPEDVLDSDYLIEEAERLTAIGEGRQVERHTYPDILKWNAPKVQADALLRDNGRLVVEGLGNAEATDTSPHWEPNGRFGWQWVRTDFGQTLLIKRRRDLKSAGNGNTSPPLPNPIPASRTSSGTTLRVETGDRRPAAPAPRPLDVDRAVEHARRHIRDNEQVGFTLREVAQRGTRDQYLAVLVSLYDDLRSPHPGRRQRVRKPNHPSRSEQR